MIGRYERDEVMPSIEVAKKIADALEVSLDYLAGNSKKAAFDKQTMKLIHDIEELEPTIKDKLIFLANAVIRDSKTKKSLRIIKPRTCGAVSFYLHQLLSLRYSGTGSFSSLPALIKPLNLNGKNTRASSPISQLHTCARS